MSKQRPLLVRVVLRIFEPLFLLCVGVILIFGWLPAYLYVSLGLRSPLSGDWQITAMELAMYGIPGLYVTAVIYKVVKRELTSRN